MVDGGGGDSVGGVRGERQGLGANEGVEDPIPLPKKILI